MPDANQNNIIDNNQATNDGQIKSEVKNTADLSGQQNNATATRATPENQSSTKTSKEELEKQKITKTTQTIAQKQTKARLERVDKYISEVEQGTVKEAAQQQADILVEEDKEEKLKRLQEAIKNNLSGYDLEKEM